MTEASPEYQRGLLYVDPALISNRNSEPRHISWLVKIAVRFICVGRTHASYIRGPQVESRFSNQLF
jgi:hypothetical protein